MPVGREAITGIDSNARPDGGHKAGPVGREAITGIDSNARPDGGHKAVPVGRETLGSGRRAGMASGAAGMTGRGLQGERSMERAAKRHPRGLPRPPERQPPDMLA